MDKDAVRALGLGRGHRAVEVFFGPGVPHRVTGHQVDVDLVEPAEPDRARVEDPDLLDERVRQVPEDVNGACHRMTGTNQCTINMAMVTSVSSHYVKHITQRVWGGVELVKS